jgi:hypothetical protein
MSTDVPQHVQVSQEVPQHNGALQRFPICTRTHALRGALPFLRHFAISYLEHSTTLRHLDPFWCRFEQHGMFLCHSWCCSWQMHQFFVTLHRGQGLTPTVRLLLHWHVKSNWQTCTLRSLLALSGHELPQLYFSNHQSSRTLHGPNVLSPC